MFELQSGLSVDSKSDTCLETSDARFDGSELLGKEENKRMLKVKGLQKPRDKNSICVAALVSL